MSDIDLDERYFLIAHVATKAAEEYGYQTGFENRTHHFEGVEDLKCEEV